MKRLLIAFVCALIPMGLGAQTFVYREASDLTLVGRLYSDNSNLYHRIDTAVHRGFSKMENFQVRCPAGIAVVFRTDSPTIKVKVAFGQTIEMTNTMPMSYRGYDLYVRRDGGWLWAAATARPDTDKEDAGRTLITGMEPTMKEFLMYLPMYAEIGSCQIGVTEGSVLEACDNPFHGRVVIHGSSFTHGISTSRSGMTYPAQLMRRTGWEIVNLGVSGNCKMQPYFADALCDVDADAFVFDAFSNPSEKEIRRNFLPFVEKLVKAHPGKPLVFQKTIYRESRNFNLDREKFEASRQMLVDSLMKVATRRYEDVYYIDCTSATSERHDTSVDGTHPSDHGYYLWSKSIEKPLRKILRKYGIK